ncbi:MAG: leucine-rich repeat domain-containing protein [Clostridia bacterium]|nr:leucine-rich repeat domain-containing protein [Clostridia bacterium]
MKLTARIKTPTKLTAKFNELKMPLSGGFEEGYERGYAAGYEVGEASGNAVIDGIAERTITEFVNHRITKIGAYAFARHSVLIKIDIPNVETIEQYGFNYCTGLTEIELPKVKTIANQAFNSCGKLTKVDAPMLEKLDGYSFTGSKLTTLIIRQNNKVCNLTSVSALRSTPIESGTGYVYVPAALVEQYKAATNWSTYASQIKPISELEE